MKRIIQLILFLFIILISTIFYFNYLDDNKKPEISIVEKENIPIENENNLIKNLKYDVKFDGNKQYTITSKLSEINYENGIEIVDMQIVNATFIDQTGIPLIVSADRAVFNNSTYNTSFDGNVIIQYLDNVILSNKIDLNFENSIVHIYENVEYDGLQGTIKADNIKINLITKKIEIYMNKKDNKIVLETK